MHKLNELTFLYQSESRALIAQQDLLRNVLEPILWNRYREKFQSLQLDQNFLADCKVSPVYEKRTKRGVSGEWNSAVKFTFPSNHPVLKGELEVAYSRATQEEFFGEIKLDEFSYDVIKDMDRDTYLKWWFDIVSKKLGKYFERFGLVTDCNIGTFYDSKEKTIILQVPHLGIFKHYFKSMEGLEKYIPAFGDYDCYLYTANDYAILKGKQKLEFRILRGNLNERTGINEPLPEPA